MLLADYAEYIKAHERVAQLFKVKYKKKKNRIKISIDFIVLESN